MLISESQQEFYQDIWNQIVEEKNEFHIDFTLRIMHKVEVIKIVYWFLQTGKDLDKIMYILERLYEKRSGPMDAFRSCGKNA